MSARFITASARCLINAASPITNYPFTMGMWVNPTGSTETDYLFFIGEQTTDNGFYLNITAQDLKFFAYDGVDFPSAEISIATQGGSWSFVVMRGISATNRRLAVIKFDGAPAHAQSTTDVTLTAPATHMSIGAAADGTINSPFDGLVGEFWYTDKDIQEDGAELDNSLLRQLAYRGPFSVPHIKKDIIEYRSFRTRTINAYAPETYFGKLGPQTWTNTNGVTIGPHVPHAAPWNKRYIRPGQRGGIITPLFVTDTPAVAGSGSLLLMGAN